MNAPRVPSGETIVFVLHPRTKHMLKTYGLFDRLKETVIITDPLGYLEFLKLLNHARKLLTDSGGIQKEAYILNVPCITLRENTEWVETVKDGWNKLVGSDKVKILDAINNFKPKGKKSNVFGDGKAGKKIIEILEEKI